MKISFLSIIFLSIFFFGKAQENIYVSLKGNDANEGTLNSPLKTPGAAIQRALADHGKDVVINITGGTYGLEKTIDIKAADFLCNSLTVQPYASQKVLITGSKIIHPQWHSYKNGILRADLDLAELPDQLYLNGNSQHMARYPNFDKTARVFNGTAADAISDERVKTWKSPAGGFIHALHQGEWGGFHYRVIGKDDSGKLIYEGGWQNNRPAPMHKDYRFVENIFEELDSPGEWFYDKAAKAIFFYPPKGTDLKKAVITISSFTDLVHISGSESKPIKNVKIHGIDFTQTARSFMLVKEPLLRSDWTIYRGGALLIEGAENVDISNCNFYELGGNAVFVNNYNKNVVIRDNRIADIGANAIAFVGDPQSVRSPAFRYELFVPWDQMDYTSGSRGNNYPKNCTAAGNLIYHIGTIEKQVAGVEIEMAAHITVSHNTIYNVPRSGINIGDGCWGGHVLEYNDVFNTVLETGDHGAFNSWGRDRYWRPEREMIDSIVAQKPGIELLDAISPVIIRNNRFQCDHGWDIDLDDGSSNYQIYNNVCLNGGLKLREGYHRIVTNNILVNNTFHPHVWLKNSGDVFTHNIVTASYAPILMNNWGREIDSNFFLTPKGLSDARQLNLDKHSASGDAQFLNTAVGNYRVKPSSPVFKTGFRNFEMDFGVTLPALKKMAASPTIKPLYVALAHKKGAQAEWLGAIFKNIETLGERSAAGLPDNKGAMLTELPAKTIALKNNLQRGDVIIKMDDQPINSISDLLQVYQSVKWMGKVNCIVIRNQGAQHLSISFK